MIELLRRCRDCLSYRWAILVIVDTLPDGISRALAAEEGCYEAVRAAALSGVPISTVYYWARTGIVVPSISPVRERLWSYADLIALRIVSWLRHWKDSEQGAVPASPMGQVRETLAFLDRHGIDLWHPEAGKTSALYVDRGGKIWIKTPDGRITDHTANLTLPGSEDWLDLLSPFSESGVRRGPDLLRPRPSLRIVPAKVAGEPHILGSRVTSRSLDALSRRGFHVRAIADMYGLPEESVGEAIDLEQQLSVGMGSAA